MNEFFSFSSMITMGSLVLAGGVLWRQWKNAAPLWEVFFFIFAVGERLCETFHTSQERERQKWHGDWALLAVVLGYLAAFFGAFYEHYSKRRSVNEICVAIGLVSYVMSLAIRWWAIKALADQWGIHSVEKDRINQERRVIREGPYQYMRHPYYLSVCIEVTALALTMNAPIAMIMGLLFVWPIEILRGYIEENNLIQVLGWPYIKYKHERGGYLPVHKTDNFDRRAKQKVFSFPDRRAP